MQQQQEMNGTHVECKQKKKKNPPIKKKKKKTMVVKQLSPV